jgi:hypothetical protein
MRVNSPRPNKITLIGQYHGPLNKFQAILGSALADAEEKATPELPYWEAQEFFDIESSPNRYQETSIFAGELSAALIEEAFSLLRTFPGAGAQARLTFFLMGGHVNKIKPDATAWVHDPEAAAVDKALTSTPASAEIWKRIVRPMAIVHVNHVKMGSSGCVRYPSRSLTMMSAARNPSTAANATPASTPCRTSALDQLIWPGGR